MGKKLLWLMPNNTYYVFDHKGGDRRWLWLERTTTTLCDGDSAWIHSCVKEEEKRHCPSFTCVREEDVIVEDLKRDVVSRD